MSFKSQRRVFHCIKVILIIKLYPQLFETTAVLHKILLLIFKQKTNKLKKLKQYQLKNRRLSIQRGWVLKVKCANCCVPIALAAKRKIMFTIEQQQYVETAINIISFDGLAAQLIGLS